MKMNYKINTMYGNKITFFISHVHLLANYCQELWRNLLQILVIIDNFLGPKYNLVKESNTLNLIQLDIHLRKKKIQKKYSYMKRKFDIIILDQF